MIRGRLAVALLAVVAAGCAASDSMPTGSGGAAGGGTAGSASAGTNGNGGTGGSATGGSGVAGTSGGPGGTTAIAGTGGTAVTGTAGGGAGRGGGGTTGAAGSAGGQGGRGGGNGGGGSVGSAGRGGTSGGTAGTTGTGGATSGCAGKTYKLCEDFENGTAGGFPTGWTGLNGYGTDSMRGVGLATDQFHSGAMALKSSSMVPGEQRAQHSLSALGATATKHWGRIFYKVISPSPKPPSGMVIHVTMAALLGPSGSVENRIVDTVEQNNGTHQWLFNIPDDSCCTGSSYNWSFDANWHCAEWFVDVSAQSYRFFTDGTEVTQIGFTGKAAAKMSNYTALAVGAIFYQTPPSPFTIWFDDLAIDDNQIGCQ